MKGKKALCISGFDKSHWYKSPEEGQSYTIKESKVFPCGQTGLIFEELPEVYINDKRMFWVATAFEINGGGNGRPWDGLPIPNSNSYAHSPNSRPSMV